MSRSTRTSHCTTSENSRGLYNVPEREYVDHGDVSTPIETVASHLREPRIAGGVLSSHQGVPQDELTPCLQTPQLRRRADRNLGGERLKTTLETAL